MNKSAIKKIFDFVMRPLCLIPLSVVVYAAIIYILVNEIADKWYSYVLYLLSAVVLVLDVRIVGAWLASLVRLLLMKIPLTRRLITDFDFRQQFSYYVSILINIIYIAINLLPGIFHLSLWPIALGIYYIALFVLRATMARQVREGHYGQDIEREYTAYRNCGIILLFLDITLGGIVTLMVMRGFGYTYSFYMCIIMAAYVFYYFIFALVQLIRFRRYHSPLLSAVRAVTFVSAMLSVLALETAMFSQFGDGAADVSITFVAVTGFVIVLFVAGLSVFMIVKGQRGRHN